jgi:phenol hydroxylase P5 protein
MPPSVQPATLLSIRQLSPCVREFVFLPKQQRISFKPGQFVSLQLPIGPRPPLVRAYSMAEPEQASGEIVLVLDRVPHGLGSEYLFGLHEGDLVMLSGPYGNFVIPDPLTKDLLFLARYTGIVPIRCMLRDLFNRPVPFHVTLIYSSPNSQERIYHQEFLALASAHANFRYLPCVLKPAADRTREERPEIETVTSLFGGRRDFLPLTCGIKAMVAPVRAYLKELGFDRREMRFETYD